MELITLAAGIIIIVFGILQIILFFKIWGMTNDIKKTYNCIQSNNKDITSINNNINDILSHIKEDKVDYKFYAIMGDKERAYQELKKELVIKLLDIRIKQRADDLFSMQAEPIIKDYKLKFNKLGFEIPKDIDSSNSFINYFQDLLYFI